MTHKKVECGACPRPPDGCGADALKRLGSAILSRL